jgi:GT2 family glycosyltransferase
MNDSEFPKVAIVLLNWNNWQDTLECLESILKLDYPNFRIILCDNASHDGSLDAVKAWARGGKVVVASPDNPLSVLSTPPIPKPINYQEYTQAEAEKGGDLKEQSPLVLIQNKANFGFAGGNNVALRYVLARDEFAYIWLLNVDTVVKADALKELVRCMVSKPKAGLAGSTLLYYHAPDEIQALAGATYNRWLGITRHLGTGQSIHQDIDADAITRQLDYIMGASLMVRMDFLREVGLMEETYFLFFEEIDWVTRARGRYTLAYAPESIVYHREGRSSGANAKPGARSLKAEFYNFRNRLRFTKKFYPYALPTVWFGLVMTVINSLRRGQGRRARLALEILLGLRNQTF